jgi:outer membrane protein OmpA-like peptidoglycan-associated protein
VRSGQTEVFVIGHASRTGSRDYNLVLAKDRADGVASVLTGEDVMGKAAKISSSSAGFDAASATGEAAGERFVEVVFEAMVDEDTDKKVASSAGPDNVDAESPAG